MFLRTCLVLMLAMASCQLARPTSEATDSPASATLEVMSFNIRYGTANDGDNRWEVRRELVVERIQAAAPDVLGLQEALAFQLDEISAALPNYAIEAAGRDDGKRGGEHSAILFDAARFERLGGATFWLAPDPTQPGAVAWGANLPRTCTWVQLRERATGTEWFVFNTHWDHKSQESRARSGLLLRDTIQELTGGSNAVLLGDFNAVEDNPAIIRLRGDDPTRPPIGGGDLVMVDTLRQVEGDRTLAGTFNGWNAAQPERRIDYVFVTPDILITQASIDLTQIKGRWPSDHCPVLATLALPLPGALESAPGK